MAKVIRYVGRESHFRGKSLFEIAANLKSCKGRVVHRSRTKFDPNFKEKSYVTLEDVKPDLSKANFKGGTVTGYRVFRGNVSDQLVQINSGMKQDWHLISKEEEEEFCKIDRVHKVNYNRPKTYQLPPTLAAKLKTIGTEKSQLTEVPYRFKNRKNKPLKLI